MFFSITEGKATPPGFWGEIPTQPLLVAWLIILMHDERESRTLMADNAACMSLPAFLSEISESRRRHEKKETLSLQIS
jgi:hypothetical protein